MVKITMKRLLPVFFFPLALVSCGTSEVMRNADNQTFTVSSSQGLPTGGGMQPPVRHPLRPLITVKMLAKNIYLLMSSVQAFQALPSLRLR